MRPTFREVGDGLVSRWLSSLVAIAYVIMALASRGIQAGTETAIYCFLAWFCVWFPDAMGTPADGAIGRSAVPTPAGLVWFIGWGLLTIPIIVIFLLWIQNAI